MRILPDTWARTLWPFSISTRNIAFGNGSTTLPSTSIASSLLILSRSPFIGVSADAKCGYDLRSRRRPEAPGTDRGETGHRELITYLAPALMGRSDRFEARRAGAEWLSRA